MNESPDWKSVTDSLDDLFEEVKVHIKAPAAPKAITASESFLSTYSNPANWTSGQAIAIIHEGSQTLVGTFREMLHIRVAGVRRLVRIESPVEVSAQEIVTEDWWIKGRTFTERNGKDATVRNCVIDTLILSELQASASAVQLRVILSWGAISRIELVAATTFESNGGALTFPAGLDILKGLSFEAKVEIRKEIGL